MKGTKGKQMSVDYELLGTVQNNHTNAFQAYSTLNTQLSDIQRIVNEMRGQLRIILTASDQTFDAIKQDYADRQKETK